MRAHPIFADMPISIFEEMSGLARATGAINLGQGFPDSHGPEDLRRAAAEALMTGSNQYAPSRGDPALRRAVCEHYGRLQGVALTPDQVVVTSGATEAIAAALFALVRPGDEVLIFEPAYDAYRPLIERAGGVARTVSLEAPLWRLTETALEAAVTGRTRLVMFNNPHNPTARAFDAEEVSALSQVCVRHDLIAISDEVWEHVLFDGRTHHSLITAAGMAARTVKIGSAGKMFGMTGWKVGFACAAPEFIEPLAKAHQFLTFSTAPNLQAAVALGLAWPIERFDAVRVDLAASRDRLAAALSAGGYVTTASEGTYFLGVDLPASGVALGDIDFCRHIVANCGVAAIPVSAFRTGATQGPIVRLCFAKADVVLDQAAERLVGARAALTGSGV